MTDSPTTFGPYELVKRLGAGGMAETFLAVRRGPGGFEQRVCLKRILPAFESDDGFVKQFLEEARVSAQLRHANIAQVLDFGVHDGSHYLALELVEGMDLYKLLEEIREQGQSLTSALVVYIGMELATALEHAHEGGGQPVVHRDISPSNVLVSKAGEVKLTDFGIAKAASQSAPLTSTGVVKGKVPYMAPEYALTGRFDTRSDLFALGVMLYEMLAGRRPFVGNTDLDTLNRISQGIRPSLIDFCPNAPPQLIAAIERLLAVNPDERYESAAAFLDALVELSPPPTSRRILGDLVRRLTGTSGSGPSSVASQALAAAADASASGSPTRTRRPDAGRLGPATVPRTAIATPSEPPSFPAVPATAYSPIRESGSTSRPAMPAYEAAQSSRPGVGFPLSPPSGMERLSMEFAPEPPMNRFGPLVAGIVGVLLVIGLGTALAVWSLTVPAEIEGPAARPETVAPANDPPPSTAPEHPASTHVAPPESEPDAGADPVVVAAVQEPPLEPDAGQIVAHETHGRRAARIRRRADTERRTDAERPETPESENPRPPHPPMPPTAPPPRRSEAQETGTLSVAVTPYGHVWINGRPQGNAPLRVQLPVGNYTVETGPDADHRDTTRHTQVEANRTTVLVIRR